MKLLLYFLFYFNVVTKCVVDFKRGPWRGRFKGEVEILFHSRILCA